jgi:putative tryptophan/tyrosine transport system substrate-binding protein
MKEILRVLVTVVLLACGVIAEAQQAKKIPVIGILAVGNSTSESMRVEGVRLALHQRGYIDEQNISIKYTYSEGKSDLAAQNAAELVRLKVDVIIVSGGPTWVQAAKNATKSIPIVMVGLGADPVESGLIESLARPGGNVTGITNVSTELSGKRLELLKESVPKLARVAVLYNPANSATVQETSEMVQTAAPALRLTVRSWEVRAAKDFDQVFPEIRKWRAHALYGGGGGPILAANLKRIVGFTFENRLPSMFNRRELTERGGLMSYGADEAESYQRVAYYVERILKGAKPADLPVQQPTKFEFVINLKTAKQIGLEIPQWTLMKADRVIK